MASYGHSSGEPSEAQVMDAVSSGLGREGSACAPNPCSAAAQRRRARCADMPEGMSSVDAARKLARLRAAGGGGSGGGGGGGGG